MTRIAAYDEPTARMLLEAVRQLIASGYVIPSDKRNLPAATPRPIYFRNDSGEEIPPYALMQITGTVEVDGQNYFKVDKYDEDVFGGFLFNWHRPIEIDGTGIAQVGPHFLAQGASGQTITTGDLWGPVANSWTLNRNGGPYLLIGEDDRTDDLLWVKLDIATTYIGLVTTEISARAESVLGSGVVTLKKVGASSTMADRQTGVPVYTMLSDTTAIGQIIEVSRGDNGKLFVVAEDCG